jgi:hypothetical protein
MTDISREQIARRAGRERERWKTSLEHAVADPDLKIVSGLLEWIKEDLEVLNAAYRRAREIVWWASNPTQGISLDQIAERLEIDEERLRSRIFAVLDPQLRELVCGVEEEASG